MNGPSRYWAATAEAGWERSRLELLQQRSDGLTFRRLSGLGPLAGRACLEVGAGAGSVAAWLAAQVGPGGSVVATDLDPRFLDGLVAVGQLVVRRHDVLADPLEHAAFDLVHCRAVLCHLGDPLAALRHMALALRPGGRLLVEEADYVTLTAACPEHRRVDGWDRVAAEIMRYAATRSSIDPYLGRRLPGLVASLGLELVTHEGIVRVQQGGSAAAQLIRRSVEAHTALLVGDGVCSEDELTAFTEALADRTFRFTDACSFAVWGQRPN